MMKTKFYKFKNLSRLLTLIALMAASLAITGSATVYERKTPIVEAVDKVLPAVVNISTTKEVMAVQRTPYFFSPFQQELYPYKLEGLGSGVVVDSRHVVTNYHVVSNDKYGPADKILITLYQSKKQYEATIYGADPKADVAILEIKGEDSFKSFLPWGRSDDLMIGETVIGVGSSLGQPFTVTSGIISALNRAIQEENGNNLFNLIQTDADINQGNSGGPLVNINGEFIGLNSAILSPSGGSVGIGFAIPVSRVKKIYDYWVKGSLSLEDRMGIVIQDMDDSLVQFYKNYYPKLNQETIKGIVMVEVVPGSLCEGKLQKRDIINQINNRPVDNSTDLRSRLEENSGAVLNIGIIREGVKQVVSVPVPQEKVERFSWMGMDIQEVDNPWRQWKNPPQKFLPAFCLVIHSVKPGSQAEKLGLQRGLGIYSIVSNQNEIELKNLSDLKNAVKSLKPSVPYELAVIGKQKGQWGIGSVKIQPGKFD